MPFLQVKLSTGSDGLPAGWPVNCKETESAVLEQGYDVVWTPAQLEAAKTALLPQYEAAIVVIQQPQKSSVVRQRIRAEALRRKQGGGFLPDAPPGNTKWLPSDPYTLATLACFAGASSVLPTGLAIKAFDGTGYGMNRARVTVVLDAFTSKMAAIDVAEAAALAEQEANPTTFNFDAIQWPAAAPGFV